MHYTANIAILPTAYMPPIIYILEAIRLKSIGFETIYINTSERFVKQSFRNRAIIISSQGEQALSVPIIKPFGSKTLVKNIEICYKENWNVKHWRSICAAYNNSPYFLYYKNDLEKIFNTRHELLVGFNLELSKFIFSKLKIDINLGVLEGDAEYNILKNPNYNLLSTTKLVNLNGEPFSSLPILNPYINTFSLEVENLHSLSSLDLLCNVGPELVFYNA